MNDNVIDLKTTFFGSVKASDVINAAQKLSFKNVVIVGTQENGDIYFSLNDENYAESLFLLEAGKKMLLDEVL